MTIVPVSILTVSLCSVCGSATFSRPGLCQPVIHDWLTHAHQWVARSNLQPTQGPLILCTQRYVVPLGWGFAD